MYKIDLFYSEMILYQFTSEGYNFYHFTAAKKCFFYDSETGTLFKALSEKNLSEMTPIML